MMLNPAMLALLLSAALTSLTCSLAAFVGIGILRYWDLSSGSERQVRLERRTYLVSTILGIVLLVEVASLFLFVLMADQLHTQFTGAMCAAGSLYASPYGYPALLLKLLSSLLCGVWLIINRADHAAIDYPLIRVKYRLLLIITVLILCETALLVAYALSLHADLITSCCGALFDTDGSRLGSDLAALPAGPTMIVFYTGAALVLGSGIFLLMTGRGGRLFGWLCAALTLLSLLAIISFISVYIYALPTHHCPFCLLQGEYSYMGYPLYGTILVGAIAGIGTGVLGALNRAASLAMLIPRLQRQLCAISLVAWCTFLAIVTYQVVMSPLRLMH